LFAYIIRRVLQGALVLAIVGFIAFSMFRFIGDPYENILGQDATVLDRQALEKRLGLDQPIVVQYVKFIGNALRGEFGVSYRNGIPVADMISERLPATIELALISALFALLLGIFLGVYTAIRRDGFLANFIMTSSLVGVSLPTFLIGILLIYVFAVELKVLPSFGRGETIEIFGWRTGLAVRGAAHRLHPVCAGTWIKPTGRKFWPCIKEYAAASHHHHWHPARTNHRLCHHH